MVPRYCFRGLSRKSRYKTEREDWRCDSQWAGGKGKEGFMTSGKGQRTAAQFSTPPALLWDSCCTAMWLGLCILHFFCLSIRGISQWSTERSLTRGKVNGVSEFLGTLKLLHLSLRVQKSYLNQKEFLERIACFVVTILPANSKLESFFSWVITIKNSPHPILGGKKYIQKHQCEFCHILQCGQDYAHTLCLPRKDIDRFWAFFHC